MVALTCCAVDSPCHSIFDGHPIPVAFAPSLYKFLLGLPVNMHDLEAFDRDTYDECVATLQTAPDELDLLGQDFEQVGEAPRDVTGDNRREFVSKLISYTLVKSRKVPCCPALSALRLPVLVPRAGGDAHTPSLPSPCSHNLSP